MNKKWHFIAPVLLIVIAVAGLYSGRLLKINKTAVPTPSSTPVPVKLTTWVDQSEFEFQYPEKLNLDPHDEDDENYAHLELTSKEATGSIILWTKDNSYLSIDEFVEGNKIANYIGTSLDGFPAIKALDEKVKDKFDLFAIREGYLYQIEVDPRGEKSWTAVFDGIMDTYKFAPNDVAGMPSAQSAPADSSDEIYFGEELIE